MNILTDKIPQSLKGLPQWVAWRIEVRDGKPTKPPVNPRTGDYAKSNDPKTWTTYEEALAVVGKYETKGIGFMFTEKSPYTGIDCDKCRDPQTGQIEPWALSIINRLLSYAEVSPSETGLHIIVKGKLPNGGGKKGKLEMYSQGRYFTVTGRHLEGTPDSIQDRDVELNALHVETFGEEKPHADVSPNGGDAGGSAPRLSDDELIQKIKASKQGPKFDRLWSGDWLEDYPSQSEADLALCEVLAFWTGKDAITIDRLFRQSALYRPKWDEKHFSDGRTYGQATIEQAISKTKDTWKGIQGQKTESPDNDGPVFEHISDLPTKVDIVEAIEGHIIDESRNILAGPPGVAKTWDLLIKLLSLSSQTPYLGRFKIPKQRACLIVDQESGRSRLGMRLNRLAQGLGLKIKDIPIWVASMKGIRLDTDEGIKLVRQAALEHGASVLGIDSMIRAHKSNENESADMSRLFEKLDSLRDVAPLIFIVAHSKKPQPGMIHEEKLNLIRGSSDIAAWIDTGYFFEQRRGLYVAECVKFRDGQRPKPFEFTIVDREDGSLMVEYRGEATEVLSKLEETANRILDLMADGKELAKKDIEAAMGEGKKQVSRGLDVLIEAQKVLRVRRGVYRIKDIQDVKDIRDIRNLPRFDGHTERGLK